MRKFLESNKQSSVVKQLIKIANEVKRANNNNVSSLTKINQIGDVALYQVKQGDFEAFSQMSSGAKWVVNHYQDLFERYVPLYFVTKGDKPQALVKLQLKLFRDKNDIKYKNYNRDVYEIVTKLLNDTNTPLQGQFKDLFWHTKNFDKDAIIKIIKKVFGYPRITVEDNEIRINASVRWCDKSISISATIDCEKQQVYVESWDNDEGYDFSYEEKFTTLVELHDILVNSYQQFA